MHKTSYKLIEIYVLLMMLFPLTTLFQNYISFLNIALLSIVVGLFVMMLLNNCHLGKKIFLWMLVSISIWLVSIINTPIAALQTNINMAIYYIFMLLYFVFFLDKKDKVRSCLNQNKKYIYSVVILFTILLTVSIFLPFSYTQMLAGGWGNEKYFVSFSGSPNRVGPACIFILVMMIFLIKEKYHHKKMIFLIIPHLYTFVMGGSRTYCVLGLCVILILYYYYVDNKKFFFLTMLPLSALILIIIMRSNMMNKIIATFQYNTNKTVFWQKLTNTRSIFWVEQLKLFRKTSVLHHFIGNGINFTTYNYGLWAHSDFIEILCSYGYIGLFNYLIVMTYMIKSMFKKCQEPKWLKFICVFIWFFNAFFNFFYCYFCAMCCYPILLLIISKKKRAS